MKVRNGTLNTWKRKVTRHGSGQTIKQVGNEQEPKVYSMVRHAKRRLRNKTGSRKLDTDNDNTRK